MGTFDDELNQLVQEGLDEEIANRLRNASGIRQELAVTKQQREAAQTEAQQLAQRMQKLEDAQWRRSLSDMGVGIDPSILSRPADLDVTNSSAIQKWALDHKLISGQPEGDNATTLQAHDQLANISTGSQSPPAPVDAKKAKVLNAGSEEEFWAAAGEGGFTR